MEAIPTRLVASAPLDAGGPRERQSLYRCPMSESVACPANLSRLDAEDSRVRADSYGQESCSPEIAVEEGETSPDAQHGRPTPTPGAGACRRTSPPYPLATPAGYTYPVHRLAGVLPVGPLDLGGR